MVEHQSNGRPLHRFDFNLLRPLHILLEERNVTRAAERLNVTQPAISAALSRIREFFGDEILMRVGREMELTPLARSLCEPVKNLMIDMQQMLAVTPAFDPGQMHQVFSVAMSDYVANTLVPRLLTILAAESPFISINVESLTSTSFHRLSANQIDFIVASDYWRGYGKHGPEADVRHQKLYSDKFVCVVARDNDLIGDDFSMEAYASLRHLVVRFVNDTPTLVESHWIATDRDMSVAAYAPTFSGVLAMVLATSYVATVPQKLVVGQPISSHVRVLPCPLALEPLSEALVWHPRKDFDPANQFMRTAFQKAASLLH